jgi:hypothetical protein
LVLSNFPETVAPDVLIAAGLDPDLVLSSSDWVAMTGTPPARVGATLDGGLRCCRRGTASAHSADMAASWREQAPGSTPRTCAGSTSAGPTTWITACACCITSYSISVFSGSA